MSPAVLRVTGALSAHARRVPGRMVAVALEDNGGGRLATSACSAR